VHSLRQLQPLLPLPRLSLQVQRCVRNHVTRIMFKLHFVVVQAMTWHTNWQAAAEELIGRLLGGWASIHCVAVCVTRMYEVAGCWGGWASIHCAVVGVPRRDAPVAFVSISILECQDKVQVQSTRTCLSIQGSLPYHWCACGEQPLQGGSGFGLGKSPQVPGTGACQVGEVNSVVTGV
jgi:hypothetical protein